MNDASLREQQRICEECKATHTEKWCKDIRPCMAEVPRPLSGKSGPGPVQREMPLSEIVTHCGMEINKAIDVIITEVKK